MTNENSNFTNFKIHTQYSICEGAIKIEDLAQYCKDNKIKAIGLSDSFNLCGALEFSETISKVGTQPIIGTQINFKYNDTIGKLPIATTTKIETKIALYIKTFLSKYAHALTSFSNNNLRKATFKHEYYNINLTLRVNEIE